jgi:DNA-binding NarL/FixJ family response regulator
LSPDILVLDIKFGSHLSGLDAARNVLTQFPDAKIVFLSQFDQDQFIKKAYKLGARAFITKTCTAKELANALKKVYEGDIYFLPQVAERLAALTISDPSPQSLLDSREVEIFTMMAEGLTNVEIAEKMGISAKTVSNVSQSIKEKLGIHRQADITLLAVKHGLVEL